MGKFVISRRFNQDYQFNLKASNNQIILTSEGYRSKEGCINGIEAVKKYSNDDSKFDRRSSRNGNGYYFVLKAQNGEIIGTSEMYQSENGMENGIESVKYNAPDAIMEDFTL
ncbi:MAG: YegP family protein [Chryseobacterium sp.]|uniref:YegP family protein n=1 Tax=Chryseobacterium sp. TaxID=1871047 RepID=UPI003D0967DA